MKSLNLYKYYFILFIGWIFLSVKTVNAKQEFIVSTVWLAEHLNDKNLVLIEIGKPDEYEKEHIPGAVFMSTKDISIPFETAKLRLQMPSLDELKNTFEKIGISNGSRIIIYYHTDWVTPSARFFLTFDYMGLSSNTSILDGGLPKWKSENRIVTSEIPKPEMGKLELDHPDSSVIADIKYVAENIDNPKIQIIDARDKVFYTGENKRGYDRPGHIKNAVSIPYSSVATENVPILFKDKNELIDLFEKSGVPKGKEIISYCHIGQQASLIYFVAKYLGYKAKVYDGSYEEWDKHTELPVVSSDSKD